MKSVFWHHRFKFSLRIPNEFCVLANFEYSPRISNELCALAPQIHAFAVDSNEFCVLAPQIHVFAEEF